MSRLSLSVGLLLLYIASPAFAQDASIRHPREIIGQELGENNKVPRWEKIVEYFRYLDGASDRVQFEQLGESSRGNPFVLATISSPENLANLEEYRQIMNRLADPRGLSDEEAESLIARGLKSPARVPKRVVRYPAANPLISGWIVGEEKLYDRAAVVDAPVGRGHVFLFGIRPIYRMQARGTYKLLFNSILYGSASPVAIPEGPR